MPKPYYFYTTLLIALLIFIACLMMNGPMRPGLPVGDDLATRLAYINANLTLWQWGWLSWMAAALSLLAFAVMLSTQLQPGAARQYGVLLVALGMAPDLMAQTLYAFVMPQVAATDIALLQFIDLLAMHLTGFLGNGLYNLGGMLLTLALLKQQPALKLWLYPGIVAWLLGLGLSVSIALQQLKLAEYFTAASMVLSTLWFVLIAWELWGDQRVRRA
ncbi:hypothetical protein J2X32_003838 [Rheinheimera pacifica]|uniref:hypothetical protein n=1 Tax=Rheinheimera pacifica TaxID=173990 RepID=UPI00285A0AF0|nr:hypothetical protein [Rheinheimera pacifica]MDR6985181.1 hypothetical protein [Rheinheimera pacifica]